MTTENRLNEALRQLVWCERTATLGTLDREGEVSLSRVPYAIDPQRGDLIIHISALASHTAQLLRHPRASVLIGEHEVEGAPVHALPRISIAVVAESCEADINSASLQTARTCYLSRFPEAEPMTQLADFRFVRLQPLGARHVAGFGAARSLSAQDLSQVLCHPAP